MIEGKRKPGTAGERTEDAESAVPTKSPADRSLDVPPKRSLRAPEFVYFLRAETTRLIKIGVSRDIRQRIVALQTGSPDKLVLMGIIRCDAPKDFERELHSRFGRDRSHGEWFRPSEALEALIAQRAVSLQEDDRAKSNLMIQAWIAQGIITPERENAYKGRAGSSKAILAKYKAARGIS